MKAKDFDKKFDDGEEIDDHVNWTKTSHPNIVTKRVSVDFPAEVVTDLDAS